jgi:hypothetical protein
MDINLMVAIGGSAIGLLGGSMIMLIMPCACVSTKQTNGTIFKTDSNKKLIDSMYNKRLESWVAPYQIIDIQTSYGRTNTKGVEL